MNYSEKFLPYNWKRKVISKIWDIYFPGVGFLGSVIAYLLGLRLPKEDIIVMLESGLILKINPSKEKSVDGSLYYTGSYEKGILEFLNSALSKGGTFIDIGANIGLFTTYASRLVGPSGKVYSFEPNPSTYHILMENVNFNQGANVVSYNFGLGSEEGGFNLFLSAHGRGSDSLVKSPHSVSSVLVPVRRFDSLEIVFTFDSVIKIDVEGFEFDVLKGIGLAIIRKNRPIIIIEVGKNRKIQSHKNLELWSFLMDDNLYVCFKFNRTSMRRSKLVNVHSIDEFPNADNVVFIPVNSLNLFNTMLI